MQRWVQRWMVGAGQFLMQPQARGPHSASGRRVPGAEAPGCLWRAVAAGRARPCAPCRGPRPFSWGQGSAPAAEGQDFPAEGTVPRAGMLCGPAWQVL